MIFLPPCHVRMYVAFFHERRYMEKVPNSPLFLGKAIKLSEIRKLFVCWQKSFYGIVLLRTATWVRGNMGNHTV